MTLVILAAGMGSRYGGMKQIDPITDDGNFIIDFSIFDAIRAGFNKVVFVIKEENLEIFKETVGNRISKHISVEYAFQKLDSVPSWFSVPEERKKPWGTTHAVLSARPYVNEPFAVINSDDFYGREAYEIIAKHLNNAKSENGKLQFCMAGYLLKNTMTENGSVNRGACELDENKHLIDIVEAREISWGGDGIPCYPSENSMTQLSEETVVSMNCWGFTPELFEHLQTSFEDFLKNTQNPVKDELYLADVLDKMIKDGDCDITVYNTDAVWLGVTYAEDKPAVVQGIKNFIDQGIYPKHLWN